MEAVKRSVMLGPGQFKQLEVLNNHWQAYAPEGCQIDDLKKTEFWSIWAAKLKPFDRIDVIADDGAWLAECLVIQAAKNWAQIYIRRVDKLIEPVKVEDNATFKVEYKGPKKLWCVIRRSDAAMIKESLPTQLEAQEWVKTHEKQVSG